MEYLTLIDGEFRSLIRNSLERFIGTKLPKQESKEKKILIKLATRVVSSLIAIQLYKLLQNNSDIKNYVSYSLVFVFILFYLKIIKV